MSMGIGFFTGFWGLIGSILLWKPWRNAYLKFLNKLSVNLAQLLSGCWSWRLVWDEVGFGSDAAAGEPLHHWFCCGSSRIQRYFQNSSLASLLL
ncbi:hypothetical protein RIF29_29614 [Crotalaria pallida]|uniref:Uncharacterized protein n=1 Tax=Crotalaria pallida TaxID=3830 RepID=A0AAN9HW20_CROPI